MTKSRYLLAICSAFAILLFGIKYSQYYIIITISLLLFFIVTAKFAISINMKQSGIISILSYTYGACSFGIGVANLDNIQKTIIAKAWIFSGVLSLGVCIITISAIFNGGWYIKK